MREIKFRVWDKKHSMFMGNQWIHLSADGNHIYEHDLGQYSVIDDNFVIQQFTGLKDSEGKEIYEGDVMRCCYPDEIVIAAVKYSEEYAAFLIGENAAWQGWLGESKIIGNVFENILK